MKLRVQACTTRAENSASGLEKLIWTSLERRTGENGKVLGKQFASLLNTKLTGRSASDWAPILEPLRRRTRAHEGEKCLIIEEIQVRRDPLRQGIGFQYAILGLIEFLVGGAGFGLHALDTNDVEALALN